MGLTTLGFSNPAACQSTELTSSGVRMIPLVTGARITSGRNNWKYFVVLQEDDLPSVHEEFELLIQIRFVPPKPTFRTLRTE
jgi:hypothetical protein